MYKKLVPLLICFTLNYGMEKPQQELSQSPSWSFLEVVRSLKGSKASVRWHNFLDRCMTLSTEEIDLVMNSQVCYRERKSYERFWLFWWAQGVSIYIRKNGTDYVHTPQQCESEFQKIQDLLDTKCIDSSQLNSITYSWKYILAHQPIVKSEHVLINLLGKLKSFENRKTCVPLIHLKCDTQEMVHLLIKEFATEQDKIRLQWMSHLSHAHKIIIMNLAKAEAARLPHSMRGPLITKLDRFLTDQELKESLAMEAKKKYSKMGLL